MPGPAVPSFSAAWGALGAMLLVAGCVAPPAEPRASAPAPVAAVPVPPALPACRTAPGLRSADFRLDGAARQGGLLHGLAPRCARHLSLDGEPVPMAPDGAFILAFDRDAPAQAKLAAELENGARVERRLVVAPGQWRIEHVNAALTGRATSEEFRRLRDAELEQIAAARALHPQSDGWRQSFRWPAVGRLSGRFGAQRIYRGVPASYHGGVDIVAPAGTPFVAPADGVVVLAADHPFTLEGNLLIVDHGMGLNSAFLHCSSLAVKVGDVVRKGQILGKIGATGRATGPHLHWAMMWGKARIDPQALAGAMSMGDE